MSERKNICGFGFWRSNLHISLEKSKIYFLAKNAKTHKAIVQEKLRFLPKNRIVIFRVLYTKSDPPSPNLQIFLHSGLYFTKLRPFELKILNRKIKKNLYRLCRGLKKIDELQIALLILTAKSPPSSMV